MSRTETVALTEPCVVVAVVTFRRPEALGELLPKLQAQVQSIAPVAKVIVVDNDPAQGARHVVQGQSGSDIEYVHEPIPGISAARNSALRSAAGADVVVFIDDDEAPSEGWLAELLESWRAWRCAAIAGPVISEFSEEPSEWVRDVGVFNRPRWPTGSSRHGASSANLLLDLAFVNHAALKFDERFGLTGGEDTLFCRQLIKAGGRIIWCDEAPVSEAVPVGRANKRWVLRRSFRAATTWSRIELVTTDRWIARRRRACSLVIQAVAHAGIELARLLLGAILRDVRLRAQALCALASACGMAAGALGYTLEEYRRN